ncbi:uncharacterized protein PB18E9.04c-like [Triticum urartu]|uniref:uncharacterized protein PB18E9.04c-like n=1 Tax=Triticum urartu TaxID=4572 RepID=UPI002043381F|nr:uncharacterized protein PB18E9.04c-like [Triticum urartu]
MRIDHPEAAAGYPYSVCFRQMIFSGLAIRDHQRQRPDVLRPHRSSKRRHLAPPVQATPTCAVTTTEPPTSCPSRSSPSPPPRSTAATARPPPDANAAAPCSSSSPL